MNKKRRHKRILELIADRPIGRQDELANLLSGQGFGVTQASVSRDLDELGVIKSGGRYIRMAPNASTSEYGRVTVTTAGDNLVIVKCGSGFASAAAVRIDSAAIEGVAGTIAGDDTIFVAVRDKKDRAGVIAAVTTILDSRR
jgi:transcriptional regulator of arginine metabolism